MIAFVTRTLARSALLACAVLVTAATPHGAAAQNFPSRPITMIYPYTVGSGADVMIRLMSQEAAKTLGQPVIVDTRSGGNGRLGLSAITTARGQPYIYGLVANSTAVNEILRDQAFNFYPGKDYT